MALNLVRNSKVFFTTNIDATTGVVPNGGFNSNNTYELQVLDGFTFSQNTNTETITVAETGTTPVRGQQSFNTSLAPVDFSFSTYIRPKLVTGTPNKITAEDSVLWNALFSSKALSTSPLVTIGGGGAGGTLTATTGLAYNAASGVLTITGSSLPTASLPVNEVVTLSGIVSTGGAPSEELNGVGTVTTSSGTSITITLITGTFNTAAGATTFTTTTSTTFTAARHGSASPQIGTLNRDSITATSVSYAFNNTTGNGLLTIAGAALPTYTVGDRVVIGGIAQSSLSAGTIGDVNQPAEVVTTSSTSLTLNLLNPSTGTVTFIASVPAFTITKCAWAEVTPTYSLVSTAASDVQQLQKFGLLFLVDNAAYAVDNCVLNQASIDFAIDGITTVAWTGQATAVRRLNSTGVTVSTGTPSSGVALFTNTGLSSTNKGVYGRFTAKISDANYISNKLSLVNMVSINSVKNSAGSTIMTAGDDYSNIAITGGNITINNNITFLTPALLGTVNKPATYYQGTRAITGNITAYLKTGGTRNTDELMQDLLEASSANPELMMSMAINVGGTSGPRVVLEMPSTVMTIPTIDVQQVISTTINFTAQGSFPGTTTKGTFDLSEENDLTVKYYAS